MYTPRNYLLQLRRYKDAFSPTTLRSAFLKSVFNNPLLLIICVEIVLSYWNKISRQDFFLFVLVL